MEAERSRRDVLSAVGPLAVGWGLSGRPHGASEAVPSGSTERVDPSVVGEWPSYQFDPANTGTNPEIRGPTGTIETAWTVPTDDAVSGSPAVADGTVYVGADDATVYAIDAVDGSVQWTHETSGVEKGNDVFGPAAVDGGTVYVGTIADELLALDASDGTERWTAQGGRGAPNVVDGTVYAGGPDGLVALDADTGDRLWSYELESVTGGPAVADGVVYVGDGNGRIHAVAEGSSRWVLEVGTTVRSAPAVGDGLLYAATAEGIVAVNLAEGKVKWRWDRRSAAWACPAVVEDVVVAPLSTGGIVGLDAASGEQQWFDNPGEDFANSPAGDAAGVFLTTREGNLHAYAPSMGAHRWTHEVGASESSPALVEAGLFVGGVDGVVAVTDDRGIEQTPTSSQDTPMPADLSSGQDDSEDESSSWLLGLGGGLLLLLGTVVMFLWGDDEDVDESKGPPIRR